MKDTAENIIKYLELNPWEYELKKIKKNSLRTYRQVRYYFWVLIKIVSDFTWDMPLEINEQNKLMFNKSTFTDLDTKEFEMYMSLLRQLYHHHYGLRIPKPNEDDFFYN